MWINIEGFEDSFQVNEFGEVRNVVTGKLLKTNSSSGYVKVNLWMNGKSHSKNVHRLVAKAFIPNPENKSQVHHKDGNKTNNAVSNLEWCTPSEHGKEMLESQKEKFAKTYRENLRFRKSNRGIVCHYIKEYNSIVK